MALTSRQHLIMGREEWSQWESSLVGITPCPKDESCDFPKVNHVSPWLSGYFEAVTCPTFFNYFLNYFSSRIQIKSMWMWMAGPVVPFPYCNSDVQGLTSSRQIWVKPSFAVIEHFVIPIISCFIPWQIDRRQKHEHVNFCNCSTLYKTLLTQDIKCCLRQNDS